MLTCHSEYGKLNEVYIKSIASGFIDQSMINQQWEELNYLNKPNFVDAVKEYNVFRSYFQKKGVKVVEFKKDKTLGIDSIYCRDSSIATDFGIILCNMGKGGRILEPQVAMRDFIENGELILGKISGKGRLEGGDVAWIDAKTLAVGRSYRTNDEGIRQLRGILEKYDIEVVLVDLPHFKGPSDVFHLMSIFSPIDKDLAVVYSPLMPIRFRSYLKDKDYEFIEVPDREFESMGCNVLATAPRDCLMVDGNPITKSFLEDAGCKVITYKGEEISVKGGGGPTCLTRPLKREI